MELSVIKRIQSKCCKFHQNEEKRVYGSDMVAFYDVLDTIDSVFNFMEEGIGLYINLDEKYIPLLEGYLNMFCEPAKCRFIITKGKSDDSRTRIDIKMISLETDKVFKR
jgi:hypothetical protein